MRGEGKRDEGTSREGQGGERRNTVTWNKSDLNGLTHSFSTLSLYTQTMASPPDHGVLLEVFFVPYMSIDRWSQEG